MATDGTVTLDTRHEDIIHDAQMDYYGKRLATCSSDRTVKVYDMTPAEPVQLAQLVGHEGPVWEVSWAHPKFGVLLASCSYDCQVIIHREVEGVWSPVHIHRFHSSSVNSIAWAPYEHGLHLACASSDGKVSIISHRDDNSWAVAHIEDGHLGANSVTWAPYTHMGCNGPDGRPVMRLATASCDKAVRVYRYNRSPDGSAGSWVKEAQLEGHSDWVRDVAWVPSGGMPCNIIASCSEDGIVNIWKQKDAGGPWAPTALPKFSAPVWRVSWSVTGNVLAVSCGDNTVTLWKETLARTWEQVSAVPDAGPGAAAAGAGAGAGAGPSVGVMG